jgi:putative Holliday junction resolvase
MAVDYGKTRVGIALSDPLHMIAQPFLTLKQHSDKALIKKLVQLVQEHDVGIVLIGNPLSHHGTPTKMSRKIGVFCKHLKKALTVEVQLWDERFTSKCASKALHHVGIKTNKDTIDQVAACIILDEYLKTYTQTVR